MSSSRYSYYNLTHAIPPTPTCPTHLSAHVHSATWADNLQACLHQVFSKQGLTDLVFLAHCHMLALRSQPPCCEEAQSTDRDGERIPGPQAWLRDHLTRTNLVAMGCAILEVKPPAVTIGPGKALLPTVTWAEKAEASCLRNSSAQSRRASSWLGPSARQLLRQLSVIPTSWNLYLPLCVHLCVCMCMHMCTGTYLWVLSMCMYVYMHMGV